MAAADRLAYLQMPRIQHTIEQQSPQSHQGSIWKRTLPHFLLIIAVVVYVFAGACGFWYLESGSSDKEPDRAQIIPVQVQTELCKRVHDLTDNSAHQSDLKAILGKIENACTSSQLVNQSADENFGLDSWDDFPSALLFTFASLCAIGILFTYYVTCLQGSTMIMGI